MSFFVNIASILVTTFAFADQQPNDPLKNFDPVKATELARKVQINGMALSPYEKYLNGVHFFGAFDIHNSNVCSLARARETIGKKWIANNEVLFKNPRGETKTAAQLTQDVINQLNLAMYMLYYYGGDRVVVQPSKVREGLVARESVVRSVGKPKMEDGWVKARHVCVGAYDYSSTNATAYGHGYIGIEPQLYLDMQNNPRTNIVSFFGAIYHEFAHQLQYWHNDKHVFKKKEMGITSRLAELSADCTAGTLLAMRIQMNIERKALSGWEAKGINGLLGAAHIFGDYSVKHEDHHGTPAERVESVKAGITLVSEWVKKNGSMKGLTSTEILNRCYNYIYALDKKFGTPWDKELRKLQK